MSKDIALRIRKPFFDPGEQINLKAGNHQGGCGTPRRSFPVGIDATLTVAFLRSSLARRCVARI